MQKQSEVAAAAGGDVARREAGVAAREQGFARREETIARREADLAARERELAKREKETCGTGAVTTMVVQAPPSGSKYTKRDVEPLLQKAHRKMGEKGILSADLPPMAAGLEREATKAMAEGDYGKAKFAAEQLYASVDAVKIDKGFIAGKINRLNAAMKGTQLADAARKEVDDLFRGATGDYGDGKFAAANGKLNKIYALIR